MTLQKVENPPINFVEIGRSKNIIQNEI